MAAIKAGGKVIGYTETDPRKNEILEITLGIGSDGDAFTAVLPDNIDIMLSGFPCKGFSIMGDRISLGKEENWKFVGQAKIIMEYKPKAVLMEQVVSEEAIAAAEALREEISDMYVSWTKVLHSEQYGDGTKRQRMWTVSIRKDVRAESTCSFEWPVALFKSERVVSLVGVIDTN